MLIPIPFSFFLRTFLVSSFGISSLKELPALPRYKLDENRQIVIDEILEEKDMEAPMPERESEEIEKQEIQENDLQNLTTKENL